MREAYQPDPAFKVADDLALRALFPEVSPLAKIKSLPALDVHAAEFIRRAPFLCLGTQALDGTADVSPRGDAPGFVRILDPRTLAIPDRPGNNRLDSLSNIVASPSVGLIFMVPGFDETLRVNGRAEISTDPALLSSMAVEGRLPRVAIVVHIAEAFLHCAKAFRRSRLWDSDVRQDRREMPSLSKMILDQTTGAPSDPAEMEKIDEGLETAYAKSMY